ncbi:MAG: CvpA family protein [Anaerolineae bacterium]|nr:CvpA family protein [Anaerolineae bacterium]
MTQHRAKKKLNAKDLLFPLLIGTLGVVGAVVAFLAVPGFLEVEAVLLLVMAVAAAVGYNRRTIRGLVTVPFLYAATGVAAILYEVTAPYIGAPFGDFREIEPPRDIKALSFFVLMLVMWIALEGVSRALFKDMSLPKIGMLDNLGGVLVHLLLGLLIAALIFNAIGYSQQWRGGVSEAKLAPLFLRTIDTWYQLQSIWFGRTPRLYTGALALAEKLGE